MSLLLDILVIAVFAFSLYTGIKKGFIRSIMGIVVAVLAVIGAVKMSPPMANYLHDKYIDKLVAEQVAGSLDELIADVESIDLKKLFEDKPQAFTDILDTFGVDFDELKSYYEKDLGGRDDSEEAVSQYIAEPLAMTLSRAAAFAILFFGILLILTVAVLLIDLVVKLPILNGANKFLGAVFGAAMGLATAWGLSMVFCALMPHLAVIYEGVVPTSVIENTVVVKFLGSLDILSHI
jgi:uncharacterized membrane protein required for colicin V production